jgi:hypothetical protein
MAFLKKFLIVLTTNFNFISDIVVITDTQFISFSMIYNHILFQYSVFILKNIICINFNINKLLILKKLFKSFLLNILSILNEFK